VSPRRSQWPRLCPGAQPADRRARLLGGRTCGEFARATVLRFDRL
jgi:hypothetical protein